MRATPRVIGLAIRLAREEANLTQQAFADKAKVSRKWLSEVENGKSTAELGKVLRVLSDLEIDLDLRPRSSTEAPQ